MNSVSTYVYCCDRKSRAAYAQSFELWQQATIEFTCHDHSLRMLVVTFNRSHAHIIRDYTPRSLYYCLFAPHICMVLFFTHIPFVVNHTINSTPPERLQQHPLLFTTNRTDRTLFVWRLNSARPSHPGHSTILLRSEIPSGICAKLRTVAASNNRVHMPRSLSAYASRYVQSFTCSYHQRLHATITLLLLVRATYMYGVALHAHPVRGESQNQLNTTGEVATLPIWRK